MEFKDLSKEERLLAVCKSIVDNRPNLALSLKEGRTNERFLSMTEWGYNEAIALKSFFIDNDLPATRRHFNTCGELDVLLVQKYDEKILDAGINHLAYALLSNNADLIERYAGLQHSDYLNRVMKGHGTPLYILQCLIKDDWTEYERVIPVLRMKVVPKFNMQLDLAFYEALAERDKPKMEQVLSALLAPAVHKRRNKHHTLLNEFISHPALCYAKLAWLKGVEVEVDSPLVPAAWLPVSLDLPL